MKQIKIYLLALLAVLSMAACGSSDDGDGNGSNEINTNKRVYTGASMITKTRKQPTRLSPDWSFLN